MIVWASAVSIGGAQSRDTSRAVDVQVRELLNRPFIADFDTTLTHLHQIQPYHFWADKRRVDMFTGIEQRLDIYQAKAESELLMGLHKAILMKKYDEMGSGVLPLLDASIAHLDSARVYYGNINQYAVSSLKMKIRLDSTFAHYVQDSLMRTRQDIRNERNFVPVQQMDIWQMLSGSFDRASADIDSLPKTSIAVWVGEGIKERN